MAKKLIYSDSNAVENEVATGGEAPGTEPSQYVKDAEVSDDGKTLTLQRKSGGNIVFTPPGGGTKASFSNPALTKDASNRVTWNVTHTLGATFIAQLSKADGTVVNADIVKSNNAVTVSWNSDTDVAANQYTLIIIA